MTREEMIEQLENTILLIQQNGEDWWDGRDIPILEAAIKAMKMKPCKDTISRSELLKAIDTYDKFGYWDHELIPLVSEDGIKLVPYIHYDDVVKCIKGTPSVQPEQKEITMEDVKTYCEQRNLVVLTKELFDTMNNTADKIYLYLKDKENIE